MFDFTERYFQNRIQKFQPSGHNYLFSKLRFSSFAIAPTSGDTDTRRAERVSDLLAGGVCVAMGGGCKKKKRTTDQPDGQEGRQAGSQVAGPGNSDKHS